MTQNTSVNLDCPLLKVWSPSLSSFLDENDFVVLKSTCSAVRQKVESDTIASKVFQRAMADNLDVAGTRKLAALLRADVLSFKDLRLLGSGQLQEISLILRFGWLGEKIVMVYGNEIEKIVEAPNYLEYFLTISERCKDSVFQVVRLVRGGYRIPPAVDCFEAVEPLKTSHNLVFSEPPESFNTESQILSLEESSDSE